MNGADANPFLPEQPWAGWFEPTPEKLMEQLPAIRTKFGEGSFAHAALLAQIGDAHMIQGLLSNPHAQDSYEAALNLLRKMEDTAAEVAWVYDKLAAVKHSSGNSRAAAGDLEKAVQYWNEHPPANRLAQSINEHHVLRRREDLDRLWKLNAFLERRLAE